MESLTLIVINAGKYQISIERQMPLEEANAAWEMNRGRHTRNKITLKINQ